MRRVIIIDNFLSPIEIEAERRAALAAEYEDTEHRGLVYPGIALAADPLSEKRIEEICKLEPGDWTTFYRRYLKSESKKQGTYIHNDCQIGSVSAILYLTLPGDCFGGLAFWKHRLYGWEVQPQGHELAPRGLKDTPLLWETVHQDGFDPFKWEMVDYVPMYFNRLVIFRSDRYHSRYPQFEIGESPETCRLIKTFFYQPIPQKPEEAKGAA